MVLLRGEDDGLQSQMNADDRLIGVEAERIETDIARPLTQSS